jgi:hypothetical protein
MPGSFAAFTVCKDVKVLTGKRLSPKNEKLVRQRLAIAGRG